MKTLALPLVLAAALGAVVFAQQDRKKIDRKPKAQVAEKGVRFEPVVKKMEGWTVHIDPALLEGEHAEVGTKCLRMLGDHLNRVSLLVQGEQLEKLKKSRNSSIDRVWVALPGPPSVMMKMMSNIRNPRMVFVTRTTSSTGTSQGNVM